ncbi:MAG: hypothetical protein ACI9W2_001100 [Gammaproteobacteria bacterium]|jgi:hypothetical protein
MLTYKRKLRFSLAVRLASGVGRVAAMLTYKRKLRFSLAVRLASGELSSPGVLGGLVHP